jgi:transmembrane sensor
MSSKKYKEYIEEIIYRHLNNEASAQDAHKLEDWLNESDDNRREYDLFAKIWKESSMLGKDHQFDKQKAWLSIEKKINSHGIEHAKAGKLLLIKYIKAAAAIVLLAAITTLTYYLISTNNSSLITVLASDGNKKIQLPDGTTVMLRRGSNIQYHKDYGITSRQVDLFGEAYFEVAHHAAMPFKITTQKSIIEEIGTSFLAKSTDTAEQVFVTSGILKVKEKADTSASIILSKGQASTLVGKVFEKDSITDHNYLFWQSGILQFENVTLRKMIAGLNEYFNANISMSDELIAKSDTIKVNFRFEKNSLNEVLDEIQLATGLIVEKRNGEVLLREK